MHQDATHMKLIEWSELIDSPWLISGSHRRQRRLDPAGKVLSAMVLAHLRGCIGHDDAPLR